MKLPCQGTELDDEMAVDEIAVNEMTVDDIDSIASTQFHRLHLINIGSI